MEGSQVQSELIHVSKPVASTTVSGNPDNADFINTAIKVGKAGGLDTNEISDGYHTIGELYEHRIACYMALCKTLSHTRNVWRSQLHNDGTSYEGWFIMGINVKPGEQISYHLPMSKWDQCSFARTLPRAPEFDGHTSKDVIERLSTL